ncbi:MAG: ribosome maturation factor RimP [Candidatus Omnitrophica bacterium]|nr:ribosome maturation factor RimP [Candidatus Omnitrophota bacterium]
MINQYQEQIESIILPFLEEHRFELVELIVKMQSKHVNVEVLADTREGGINLDQCAFINKYLSSVLEEKDIIEESYTVSVNSPGLDRPLKTKRDFEKRRGQSVRVHLKEKVDDKLEHTGLIGEVSEDAVRIKTKEAEVIIPLLTIQKALLVIS